jgi:hypothetical protein
LTGFDRKTIARYWNDYLKQTRSLGDGGEIRDQQEIIVSAPKYDTSNRRPKKYTAEIDQMLDAILAGESAKDSVLGASHKQRLTNQQIHRLVRDAGHDIGLTQLTLHLKKKRETRVREAFIRQDYEYGQRLEYDFGEVKLVIAGQRQTCYMAILSSPGGEFRWAYLYRSQKKEVFL